MVKSHYYEQIFNYLREKLKDRFASVYRNTECISDICVFGKIQNVLSLRYHPCALQREGLIAW